MTLVKRRRPPYQTEIRPYLEAMIVQRFAVILSCLKALCKDPTERIPTYNTVGKEAERQSPNTE